MKVIFKYNDVWDIVAKGYKEPTTEEETNLTEPLKKQFNLNRKKDLKALSFIHSAMDGPIMFEKIAAAESSHKAWNILENIYKVNTRVKNVKLQHLKSEFESLKMKRSETASEYVDHVTSISNNMKALGYNILESEVVYKILRSMTPKYDTIICMLDERSTKEDLSIDEVLGTLLVHEKRLNSYEPEE
ncbi:capsid protein [Bienertia sinuspersici]